MSHFISKYIYADIPLQLLQAGNNSVIFKP